MNRVQQQQAIKRLEQIRDRAESIRELRYTASDVAWWYYSADAIVASIFGEASEQVIRFREISVVIDETDLLEDEFMNELMNAAVDSARYELQRMTWEVEDIVVEDACSAMPADKKVFIVHGHDDGLKDSVARFLISLGLNPVILHEQANAGRTMMEKFDAHADVDFAIALLTADDVGASVEKREVLNKRARQNVIFELGYFAGKLGRARTVALVKDQVELPSNLQGVLYVAADDGGAWRFRLAVELQSAGLDVDLNKLK